MARSKKGKRIPKSPRLKKEFKKKIPSEASPEIFDNTTICWQLGKIDWDGPWGNSSTNDLNFKEFIKGWISNFETMTWAEIFKASGGRSRGNNHHPINVSKLSVTAKKRLKDIKQADIDSVVSLRIDSRKRLYGIRDGRAMQLLWYDPWHDKPSKAVCPTKRR